MTPDQVAARLAVAELELEAKGAAPADARAATRRAAGLAAAAVEQLRPGIREAAFEDLFAVELGRVDPWLQGVRRARAEGSWEAGLRRVGVEVGPQTRRAWGEW